jgi:hypothetical protein
VVLKSHELFVLEVVLIPLMAVWGQGSITPYSLCDEPANAIADAIMSSRKQIGNSSNPRSLSYRKPHTAVVIGYLLIIISYNCKAAFYINGNSILSSEGSNIM